MNFKNFVIFFSLVIATTAAVNDGTKFMKNYLNYNASVLRTDNYLDLNRRQYADYILECDKELDNFRNQYAERLNTISIQLEMLVSGIIKTNERLNPLEILSDVSKDCVAKYRSKVPTVAATKTAIQACIAAANAQINNMVSGATTTKNNLNSHYVNNFERDLKTCATRFPKLDVNYTECLSTVVAGVNTITVNNIKTFHVQMDAAHCTSKAHVKTALDCSFLAQHRTISMNAEANIMIDRCIHGLDDCERCSEGHFCDSVYYVPLYQIDYNNSTMLNPFYGRNSTSNCLMLEIY